MIVVKVELWPGGDASNASPLGIACIRNTGEQAGNDADHFFYQVEFSDSGQQVKRGRKVTHYRRRGWRKLVRTAMDAVL